MAVSVRGSAPFKALLFISLVSLARAQTTHTVQWINPATPNTLTASAGDTINFQWTSNHNVYRMSEAVCTGQSFACDFNGATLLSTNGLTGPHAHVVPESDKGKTVCFSCDVAAHCTGGQKLYLTVPNDAATAAATTAAPAATSAATGAPAAVSVGVLLTAAFANYVVFVLALTQ